MRKPPKPLSKRALTVLKSHDLTLNDIERWTFQQIRLLKGCGLQTALELDAHRPHNGSYDRWRAAFTKKRMAEYRGVPNG